MAAANTKHTNIQKKKKRKKNKHTIINVKKKKKRNTTKPNYKLKA